MRPEDLTAYASMSDPQIHPDGTRIAFVVSRMNFDQDRYDRSIWLWDGSEARVFTHGPVDSRPRWSPDGESLAFLRASGEPGEHGQVAVIGAAGGEATVVTDFEIGASEVEWSPGGAQLAVLGLRWEEGWADLDDDERGKTPRRISGPLWRFDDKGYLHDRRTIVYLVDPSGGDPVALTDDAYRDSGIVWRRDGSAIGFLSARHDRAGFDSANQAWEVSIGGGAPTAIVGPGMWSVLSYSPADVPHLIGLETPGAYPGVNGLFRIDDGALTRLAGDYDRNLLSPGPTTTPPGPQWLSDGSCRLISEDRGTHPVIEVAPHGAWHEVTGGNRLVTGMTTRSDGSAMALVSTSVADPGELAWFEDGVETTLTEMNASFRSEAGLVEPEHFVATVGDIDLDVWVFLPPGDEPVPVLFNIHGGPATQYGWGFFDEFQVYVGAGYGVVATNPRGSSGRGNDFVRAPVEVWGKDRPQDMEDLLGAFEAAMDRFDRLDPDRAGIMGGSYGGLMTARILAVDDRWKSAVPERGLYNFMSFAGTSDVGFTFPRRYLGEWQYDDWAVLWEASPLKRAHLITTPCLILHSESDLRCPMEQGEQLFSVLIDNGVEAELLRFPGEGHELSRGGKPKQRRIRFEAILEWHARHLGPVTSNQ
ncbi:MAG: S9 family peptidase [Acidobacteria bacterium]|nr:S9 family peptidase [Acidobacteriota bacterium]